MKVQSIGNIISVLMLLGSLSVYGNNKTLGILNFELIDKTIRVNTQTDVQEKTRTELIKPLLVKALASFDYKIKSVDEQLQNRANQAIGYIYSHPDVASELGQKADVDYVIVGRLYKPSYLFAYIIVRVVDVQQAQIIAHHVVEAKGEMMKTTRKSIPSLAGKIVQTIRKHSQH